MSHIVEKEWTEDDGLRCVIVFQMHTGSRCGYVFIPKEHSAYKEPKYYTISFGPNDNKIVMDYCEMYENIDVHGGLTFGIENKEDNNYPVDEPREGLWIGFDANHVDDCPDYDKWSEYISNIKDDNEKERCLKLFKSLMGIDIRLSEVNRTIKSFEFMEQECKKLVKQLRKIKGE